MQVVLGKDLLQFADVRMGQGGIRIEMQSNGSDIHDEPAIDHDEVADIFQVEYESEELRTYARRGWRPS